MDFVEFPSTAVASGKKQGSQGRIIHRRSVLTVSKALVRSTKTMRCWFNVDHFLPMTEEEGVWVMRTSTLAPDNI